MNKENDPDRNAGLYRKFEVKRTDPVAQEKHAYCRHFVLDLFCDPLALPALVAYEAAAREAGYIQLAYDLSIVIRQKSMKPIPMELLKQLRICEHNIHQIDEAGVHAEFPVGNGPNAKHATDCPDHPTFNADWANRARDVARVLMHGNY